VPDLTIDNCPTCGMPVEILERTDTEVIARCILLHDFTIPIKPADVRVPEPVPVAPVIPFRVPKASTRPEWARRMAWFAAKDSDAQSLGRSGGCLAESHEAARLERAAARNGSDGCLG